MEITYSIFTNKFNGLPPELQDAITSPMKSALVRQIAIARGLNKEQYLKLGHESTLLMMDLRTKAEFLDKLRAAGIPADKAQSVLDDVAEHILNRKTELAVTELPDEEIDKIFAVEITGGPSTEAGLDFLDAKLGNRPPQQGNAFSGTPAAPAQPKPSGSDPYREPLS